MRDYSKLTPIKEDVMHRLCEAYEIGHADGYNEGHQKGYDDRIAEEEFDEDMRTDDYIRGLNDAWECAIKIVNSPLSDAKILEELFDTTLPEDVLPTTSASVAIAKIKEYEEKQKVNDGIKVGDEVKFMDNSVGVVTYVYESMSDLKNSKKLDVIMANGKCSMTESVYVEKTGRYFAIAGMLSQMKEGQ